MKTEKPVTTMQMVSEAMRTMLPYTQIGWQLIATILFFYGIGWLLDKWWGTSPWCAAALALVGVIFSIIAFIRQVTKQTSKENTHP